MKGKSLISLLFMVGLSHAAVVLAGPTFKTQDAVLSDYANRMTASFEPFYTVTPDMVAFEKTDVNRDGSEDLVLFDKSNCESATECEIDVYLCTNDEENCEDGQYCFADNIYKDQLKTKGRKLECQ